MPLKDELENVLPFVTKPGRYLGNEWNAVVKKEVPGMVRVLLAYPDLYEVGMSHLGLKVLYELINQESLAWAERVFAPAPDMKEFLEKKQLPLFSLESTTPMASFSFVGFTLQYELNYSTILSMLNLGKITLWQKERKDGEPFIIAGGPGAFNPEPLADFFDLFVLGDGEKITLQLLELYKRWRKEGGSRKDYLRKAAQLPGVYVPSFYEPIYRENIFEKMSVLEPEAPLIVKKNIVWELEKAYYPTRPVVPYIDVVHDRAVLELFRGCSRGCRFCQAGMLYRPVRHRSPALLEKQADDIIAATGYEELSLSSLSSGDYPGLLDLVRDLKGRYINNHVELNLPSLRLNPEKMEAFASIQDFGKGGLTFAPEAGTQRLRNVINKNLTRDEIVTTSKKAVSKGRKSLKLYFMLGLPTETDEDITGIVELVEEILSETRRAVGGRKGLHVTVSTSIFVPKPHTPFQWVSQLDKEKMWERIHFLRSKFKKIKNVSYTFHDPEMSLWEAVLSRGDRRLSNVLIKVWQKGGYLEGWTDYFSPSIWEEAMREERLDPSLYAEFTASPQEPLPWDHLSCQVTKKYLWDEYRKALSGKTTPDCRSENCTGCGLSCAVISGRKKE